MSVDTTTLKYAKFMQKVGQFDFVYKSQMKYFQWCDKKGITSIVKYNYNEKTEKYDVELELMGHKGVCRSSDEEISTALNEASRLMIVQLPGLTMFENCK